VLWIHFIYFLHSRIIITGRAVDVRGSRFQVTITGATLQPPDHKVIITSDLYSAHNSDWFTELLIAQSRKWPCNIWSASIWFPARADKFLLWLLVPNHVWGQLSLSVTGAISPAKNGRRVTLVTRLDPLLITGVYAALLTSLLSIHLWRRAQTEGPLH
jgi:hypothetical protein